MSELLSGVSEQAVKAWLPWAPWLSVLLDLRELGMRGAWTLSLGWAFLLFLLLYWIVPNRSFRFGAVWPGAALAALLFLGITELFPLYRVHFADFNRYGAAFALVLLLLTWCYFLAHIILFGLTLNAFLETRRSEMRGYAAARSGVPARSVRHADAGGRAQAG